MCIRFVDAVCSRMSRATALGVVAILLGAVGIAQGQIIIPGADGSDGPLNCGTLQGNPDYPCGVPCESGGTYTIDLSAAAPRAWGASSEVQGRGVYDYEKWAVVFKYSCVDIPANVTIEFKNHPSGAPVAWLVQGSVNIAGTVSLNGGNGHGDGAVPWNASGGPGGFRGGIGRRVETEGNAGFGPGGSDIGDGQSEGSGAGHASEGRWGGSGPGSPGKPYANARIIPLIGGSGGAGGENWSATDAGGGGAGGGAILVAATTFIRIDGTLRANGAYGGGNYTGGGGSGGAIRLIADAVSGGGALQAYGAPGSSGAGGGGAGRIRVEANSITLIGSGDPVFIPSAPGATAVLWPAGDAPSVRVASLGGLPVPTDPRASLDFPQADVTLTSPGVQPLVVEASNVPLDWIVDVRVVPKHGQDLWFQAFYVSGDELQSVWQAAVQVSSGFSAIQARAHKAGAARASDEASLEEDVQALPEDNAGNKG